MTTTRRLPTWLRTVLLAGMPAAFVLWALLAWQHGPHDGQLTWKTPVAALLGWSIAALTVRRRRGGRGGDL